MIGVMTKVLLSRGFGFLRGDDGVTRFVYCRDVVPVSAWDRMHEGLPVSFEHADTKKGAKAIRVEALRGTPKCDGNHALPVCADKECWNR